MTDLRDQIATEIRAATPQTYADALRSADAVLAVLREQRPHPWYVNVPLLRKRIEALPVIVDTTVSGGAADFKAKVLALLEAEWPQGRDAHRASGAQGGTSDRGAG